MSILGRRWNETDSVRTRCILTAWLRLNWYRQLQRGRLTFTVKDCGDALVNIRCGISLQLVPSAGRSACIFGNEFGMAMATATSQLPDSADSCYGPPSAAIGRTAPGRRSAPREDERQTYIMCMPPSLALPCLGIMTSMTRALAGRARTRSWTPSLATVAVAVSAALAAREHQRHVHVYWLIH